LIESQTLELEIDDPGLLYGATVFTTLRVYDNSLDSRLTYWRSHCDRLKFSLQTFDWRLPDEERLRQGAQVMMAHFPVLRITIFPDGREWITGRLLPKRLERNTGEWYYLQFLLRRNLFAVYLLIKRETTSAHGWQRLTPKS
jgi:4-amino-4-deoxychorismate lyase